MMASRRKNDTSGLGCGRFNINTIFTCMTMTFLAITSISSSMSVATAFQPPSTTFHRTKSKSSSLGASIETRSSSSESKSNSKSISTLSDNNNHNNKKEHSSSSSSSSHIQSIPSHALTIPQMNPILQFNKNGKDKVLNLTGLYHLIVIVSTMPFWLAAMATLRFLGDTFDGFDINRSKFDYSGKIWCRSYLSLTNCFPTIDGDLSRLEVDGEGNSVGGPCMFVANHCSFLDIAVLCCVLDPVFKFIAKDSLSKFPGVGQQLVGGEHVLIDRTNKRSQLRTFKQGINYLKNGVPIMAFPEGARSPDGRLMDFKGGIFSMAVKAKVPIVPLSLANTHAVMPNVGFLPVQDGRDKLRVYVHDAISVEGKSEEEIVKEVREALLSELPLDQHPLSE